MRSAVREETANLARAGHRPRAAHAAFPRSEAPDNHCQGSKEDLTLVSALATRQIAYLHPNQPLETAMCCMDRWPPIPVVSRTNYRKLEGVLSQQDVLRRYGAAG